MPRWEPDARERLVRAALDLFAEQGFDTTTAAQIATRAGLTRSTFFRYFPDKRDVLSAGQEILAGLLTQGIADAPDGTSATGAVHAGLQAATQAFTTAQRDLGPKMQAAISASVELQARQAVKDIALTSAMAQALMQRGEPEAVALVAAELGGLAFRRGYRSWLEAGDDAELGQVVQETLDEVAATARGLRG